MKHWVFDLDGTLVDSHTIYFTSLQQVFAQLGAEFTQEDKNEVLRISSKDRESFFQKRLGIQHARRASALLMTRIQEDHRKIQPFAGVRELLDILQKSQAKIAVWTARELDSAQYTLEHTGLNKYISLCVSGSCVQQCKPHPEGLLRIAKHFACEPAVIHMVGDHDNDMNAAKACGAMALRAQWLHTAEAKADCSISDWQFSEVHTLIDWIQKVCIKES